MLSTDGALCRTVSDCAALLDLMAGYETGDATWAPAPPEPFAQAAGREPGKLRIGLTLDMPIEADLDPVCERGARDAAELLASLGHEVEQVEAPWAGADLLPIFSVLWATNVAASVMHAEIVGGAQAGPDTIEPLTAWLNEAGRAHTAPQYVASVVTLQSFARAIIALWDRFDVVLTPGLAQRPVRIGEIDACGENPAYEFKKSGEFTPYTAAFNITGQPALSVPLFQGDDGLPLPVQLVGRPADEITLLQLAGQLEQARPWADRLAPIASASPA
jgi:amidase